jgi:hypothetical protein
MLASTVQFSSYGQKQPHTSACHKHPKASTTVRLEGRNPHPPHQPEDQRSKCPKKQHTPSRPESPSSMPTPSGPNSVPRPPPTHTPFHPNPTPEEAAPAY